MPLYHNKFIRGEDDKPVQVPRYGNRVLNLLVKQDKDLIINDLIQEIEPVPTQEFDYGDVSTHRWRLKTPKEINHQLGTEFNVAHWDIILNSLPHNILAAGRSGQRGGV